MHKVLKKVQPSQKGIMKILTLTNVKRYFVKPLGPVRYFEKSFIPHSNDQLCYKGLHPKLTSDCFHPALNESSSKLDSLQMAAKCAWLMRTPGSDRLRLFTIGQRAVRNAESDSKGLVKGDWPA